MSVIQGTKIVTIVDRFVIVTGKAMTVDRMNLRNKPYFYKYEMIKFCDTISYTRDIKSGSLFLSRK